MKEEEEEESYSVNKQREVITFEHLMSHIEQAHDNSTCHAINTAYINSTKETSSQLQLE